MFMRSFTFRETNKDSAQTKQEAALLASKRAMINNDWKKEIEENLSSVKKKRPTDLSDMGELIDFGEKQKTGGWRALTKILNPLAHTNELAQNIHNAK